MPSKTALRLSPLLLLLLLPALNGANYPDVDTALNTGAIAAGDAAVVIGVEDYSFLADVPHAQRDARGFYNWLVYSRGVAADRITLMDSGATREAMLEALAQLGAQVEDGGTAWVYFAGHGVTSDGAPLLLGGDTRVAWDGVEERSVPVAEVRRLSTASGAQLVFVADASFNGLARGGAPVYSDREPAPVDVAVPEGLSWVGAGGSRGPAVLENVRHGAFTYLLLGGLRGWADGATGASADGVVTADEVTMFLAGTLAAAGLAAQRPALLGEDLSSWRLTEGALEAAPDLGEVARLLRLKPGQEASVVAVSQEALDDAVGRDWAAAQKMASIGNRDERVAALESFINRYHQAAWLDGDTVIAAEVPQVVEARAQLAREKMEAVAEEEPAEQSRPLGIGVHVGTQTGVRAQFEFEDGPLDSVGVRAGLTVGFYQYESALYPLSQVELTPYVEFRFLDPWQLSVGVGLTSFGSGAFLAGDVAAQYDFEAPFQLELGVGGSDGVFNPRATAGMVW